MSRNTCGVIGKVFDQYNQTPPAFNGQPIRIQLYFTKATMNLIGGYPIRTGVEQSLTMLNGAKSIFRNHTLDLNYPTLDTYNSVIPYDSPIYVNTNDEKNICKQLMNGIDHKEENRLIVIFSPIDSGLIYGICMLHPEWLPFVIVDPRCEDPVVLAHEIGHACRCAHVKDSIMETCLKVKPNMNFENIHAYELYKSYWCVGPKPTNWSVTQANYHYEHGYSYRGPYMWEPYDNPTP